MIPQRAVGFPSHHPKDRLATRPQAHRKPLVTGTWPAAPVARQEHWEQDWRQVGPGHYRRFERIRMARVAVGTDAVTTKADAALRYYFGGVLMPDGRIFCVPYGSTYAAIYDPVADAVTTKANAAFSGNDAYTGGVLMPDGRVFCVPFSRTYAAIYDPVADAVTTKADAAFSGSNAYTGGVLMPDGRVFCVPRNITYAAIYDPVADAVTTKADAAFTGNVGIYVDRGAWNSGTAYIIGDVVSSGGNSYICILGHTNQVPPNIVYWTLLSAAYTGGVLMPDGRIFCVPYSRTYAAIYDPVADAVTTKADAAFSGSIAYWGGVLMPDGRVFCVPFSRTYAAIYDPVADAVTTKADAAFSGSNAYTGGVLMPDGRVFCVPRNITYAAIYSLGVPATLSPARVLSAYDNKL